jgi:hypothetical protein
MSLGNPIRAIVAEQYYEQVLGRVFRRKDVVPIIIDIVDRHGVLEKHFRTRKREYIDKGGKITLYNEIE